MSSPLSNLQKRLLCQLARRAYNRTSAIARGKGQQLTLTEEQFRHDQVAQATGKLGLRCCSQADYKTVEAHFLHLIGEDGRALASHMQAHGNDRRIAEYKVLEACKEFGLSLNYAEAICRQQHKGQGLQDVGTKALWHIIFTLRNRGRAKARAQKSAASHSSHS